MKKTKFSCNSCLSIAGQLYEHLTYFDDLLEGIGTPGNYSKKDSIYFGKLRSGRRTMQHPLRVLRNRSYHLVPVDNPVWICIDIPQKTCTLHSDPQCSHVKQIEETPFLGVEILRRDGGWLKYNTREDALRIIHDHYPQYRRVDHC